MFCQFYVLSNIGLVDSSGMRITYTSELREYDAGLLTTGVQIGPKHMIPPHETDFVTTGFCKAVCIEQVRIFLI